MSSWPPTAKRGTNVSQSATSRAMPASSQAHTYARAIFEVALEDWLKGLQQVATGLNRNANQLQALTDDSKGFEARQTALMALLPEGLAKPIRNFLFGMLANGDMALLSDVVAQLRQMASAGGPQSLAAEVTSAVELTADERTAVVQRMNEQFGSGLDFKFTVDPAILGGLVIRVGDKLLDDSIASRLAALRQSLGVASR